MRKILSMGALLVVLAASCDGRNAYVTIISAKCVQQADGSYLATATLGGFDPENGDTALAALCDPKIACDPSEDCTGVAVVDATRDGGVTTSAAVGCVSVPIQSVAMTSGQASVLCSESAGLVDWSTTPSGMAEWVAGHVEFQLINGTLSGDAVGN